MVGLLVAITHHFRRNVQKQRNLELTSVHVLVSCAVHTGGNASVVPVSPSWEQRHRWPGDVGLLNDVGERVISAVSVDHSESINARCAQRAGDINDHGGEGGGADTDRSTPRRVLVGAGYRHRRQQEEVIALGDCFRDRARHDSVGY